MSAGLPIHPAADLFPMLPASELQALADDIRTNGQREPVVLWDGQVLDGRNRLAACDLAGVEPLTRTLDVCPDPVAFVLSLNLIRRHLNESQRAMVAAKVRPMLAEQAKARMLAGVKTGNPTPNLGEGPAKGESADQAAAMLNVGRGTVEAAAKVLKHGTPELVEAVERGGVAVSAAAAVASLPAEDQREAVAGGAGAIREKAKAIREAKPKAPPPVPARHPVLNEIDGAADLGALDRAFNRVALAGLSEDDSAAAGEAYRRRSAELRAQADPTPAPVVAPPSTTPKAQAPLFADAPVAAPPSDAGEVEALRAEVAAYRAWIASLRERAEHLPILVKNSTPNLDRARKLVELAGSPNENEARSAAMQACRMIREQGIRLASDNPLVSSDPLDLALRGLYDAAARAGIAL